MGVPSRATALTENDRKVEHRQVHLGYMYVFRFVKQQKERISHHEACRQQAPSQFDCGRSIYSEVMSSGPTSASCSLAQFRMNS